MTTYTIKPIEWRETRTIFSDGFLNKNQEYIRCRAIAGNGEEIGECCMHTNQKTFWAEFRHNFTLDFSTLDEAKSFIETSYREFVEQFLEKQ